MSRRSDDVSLKTEYWVSTMYKRRADKIRPVNSGSGEMPGGVVDWKRVIYTQLMEGERKFLPKELAFLPFSDHIIPKVSKMTRGSRLTPERIARFVVGEGIWPEEKKFLLEILFAREAALSWSFDEIGEIRPEVHPLIKIRTVEHEVWQEKSFPVPRAIKDEAIQMLRERVKNRILEPC